jgi:hypothetical protein
VKAATPLSTEEERAQEGRRDSTALTATSFLRVKVRWEAQRPLKPGDGLLATLGMAGCVACCERLGVGRRARGAGLGERGLG